jgi:NADH-quinone oxidoreductase subunit G
MADLVTLTIDGRQVQAAPGTLVIEVAKRMGIEVPAFCYYEGLSLQAACRMCLVEVEKMPKLQTACTLTVAEGMVVRSDTDVIRKARKSTLEFLLTNHPLDCPVCDQGGECELQDMVFRYGAGESRFSENKLHIDEQQWSPIVFFDRPRCILCYRCVRICNEGMGVGALGITNRGVISEIAPSHGDHLECDECGNCVDICPVGALTEGPWRYKARPWELNHVGTICTHCSNGCKTTLGVRNDHILRCNNRDRSGINGDFLCIKGRYAHDFTDHQERLTTPLMRVDGQFQPVSWSRALITVARKFAEVKERGGRFGVIGSNHTTNEENYYLQRFARAGLGTENIDHHRTGDLITFMDVMSAGRGKLATVEDLYTTKAALVVGADLAQQQPLLHYKLRENWRHHGMHMYAVTPGPVREDKYAVRSVRYEAGGDIEQALESIRDLLAKEPELTILFGDTVKTNKLVHLAQFADSLGIPLKWVCLVDYSNSRGAADMGLLPGLGPGYQARPANALNFAQMIGRDDLDVVWVVGANPLKYGKLGSANAFVVVQEMFMTETAMRADVIFPAASAYERDGTFTNVCGQVQLVRRGNKVMGTKPDLEIMSLLAKEMKLDLGIAAEWKAIFNEIRRTVKGYDVPLPTVMTGGAPQAVPVNGRVTVESVPELVSSARDTLFTSGTLGRYSRVLRSVLEYPGELYSIRSADPASGVGPRPHGAASSDRPIEAEPHLMETGPRPHGTDPRGVPACRSHWAPDTPGGTH